MLCFPAPATVRRLGVVAAVVLPAHWPAQASVQLAEKAGCQVCHAADKKVLGPSWRDIATRYKAQADAPIVLAQRVRKGSQGVWGPVLMPPTDPKVLKDADLKLVVAWILKTP